MKNGNYNSMIVELNGKRGLVNHQGVELIPSNYDSVKINEFEESDNTHFVVTLNGKQGLYDSKGKLLVHVEFEEVIPMFQGKRQ